MLAAPPVALVRPWEEVGVTVPVEGRLRTGEALRLTNHDWTVSKVSLITAPEMVRDEFGQIDPEASENSDLFQIKNPQMCMTVREDTRSYLGTVGKNYGVVQNSQAVEFFDEALGPDAACVTAVGTLGRYGARFFMVASLPEMLEIVPGEPIERHILLTNTHDGTGAVEALFIGWDKNKNTMVHAPGGRVTIRHTKNATKRIKTAHQILVKNEQFWDRAKRAFSYMAKRDAGDARAREFVEALFPDIVEKDDDGNDTVVGLARRHSVSVMRSLRFSRTRQTICRRPTGVSTTRLRFSSTTSERLRRATRSTEFPDGKSRFSAPAPLFVNARSTGCVETDSLIYSTYVE